MAGISSLTLSLIGGATSGSNSVVSLDTSLLLGSSGGNGAVGNATQTYQLYKKNNAKFRADALKDPMVKKEIDYFKSVMSAGLRDTTAADAETKYFFEKINSVKTVDALFQDKRLTDYIATAMGIGHLKDNVALLKQVLTTKPASSSQTITGTLTNITTTPGSSDLTATVAKVVSGTVKNYKTDPATGAIYGTITDPLLGDVYGTINGATVDGLGNLTGSINAKVTGKVTNQKPGTAPGTFIGTVTGDVMGEITRSATGTVGGVITGTLTVSVNAPVTGNVTSFTDNSGVITGTVVDPITGLTVTGTITGKTTDPITGKTTGTISGATSGTISGTVAPTDAVNGTTSVSVTGTVTGTFVDGMGVTMGTINDPVLGPITGRVIGSNQVIGPVTGTITGNLKGTTNVTVTTGSASGTLSNIVYDSVTMKTTATVSDPLTGSSFRGIVSAQSLDRTTGNITGTITASVADPATISVTGTLSGVSVAGSVVTATVTESRYVYPPKTESTADPRLKEAATTLVLYEGLGIIQNSIQQSKFRTEYYQAVTTEKTVRDEIDYFESKIGNITSVDDIFKDQRMSDYIAKAFGLDAYIGNPQALKAALLNKPLTYNPDPNVPYDYRGVVFDPKLKTAAEALKLYDGIGTIKTSVAADKLENAYIEVNNKSPIKTVDDIFKDQRLLKFLLKSVGLEDQMNNTALIKKALLSDPSNADSLSAKLSDKRFKEAAGLMQLYTGVNNLKAPELVAQLIAGYENVSYEGKIAQENESVFLARYAETKLGNIKNVYELLSDKNLRTVVGGAFGIPQQIVVQGIETQAAYFTRRVDFTKLSDPKYVTNIISNYLTKSDLGQIS